MQSVWRQRYYILTAQLIKSLYRQNFLTRSWLESFCIMVWISSFFAQLIIILKMFIRDYEHFFHFNLLLGNTAFKGGSELWLTDIDSFIAFHITISVSQFSKQHLFNNETHNKTIHFDYNVIGCSWMNCTISLNNFPHVLQTEQESPDRHMWLKETPHGPRSRIFDWRLTSPLLTRCKKSAAGGIFCVHDYDWSRLSQFGTVIQSYI